MQIFTPFTSPLEVAKCLDNKRLRIQINECKVIMKALCKESTAWANHPVTKQFQYELLWQSNSSKVLIGVFKSEQLAKQAIIDHELIHQGYNDCIIEQVELNAVSTNFLK